jgi:hypothetical protein
MSAASARTFLYYSNATWESSAFSVHLLYQEHDEV